MSRGGPPTVVQYDIIDSAINRAVYLRKSATALGHDQAVRDESARFARRVHRVLQDAAVTREHHGRPDAALA